ncbi:hypothetical protein [Leptospira weilii]|uniref:hypothetical protein n=1 Tax=Leptospira weilii TaxID=28184 RepID=UPI001EF17DDD|nr:hypothetical protein [Leptospira weilii]ULH30603.1 hypothetical protein FH586_15100 [Leptospira weilii]
MNGGSGSMGQRFTQAVKSEVQSRVTGAVAEATGLPASLVGALVGGSSMKDAVKAYVKDETVNAISKATGIPAWMISNQMEKMNKPKEQWYQSQEFQMVTTVVAVAAAPFTGGASLMVAMAVGAGIGAATGAASGGLKGALVGAVGGAAGAAVKSFTGGAVNVGLSYSAENGFGASVGVGYGPATVSVGISERGGTSVDVGLTKGGFNAGVSYNSKTGSVSANAGFTSQSGTGFALSYSEGDGFGASLSKSFSNGLNGGISWSEKGGVGGNIGYEAPGDKDKPKNSLANQMKGAGGTLSFSQRDGLSAALNASGGVNAGNWSQSGGFQANTNYLMDSWKADFVSKQGELEELQSKGLSKEQATAILDAQAHAESKAAQEKNNQESGKSVLDGAAISTQRREDGEAHVIGFDDDGPTPAHGAPSSHDPGQTLASSGSFDPDGKPTGGRQLSAADVAEFKADWRKESPAQTDASIAGLKAAGYDTSGLEKFVNDYRNAKAANNSQVATTTHPTQSTGFFTNAYNAVVGSASNLWDKVVGRSSAVISTGPEHYDTVLGDKLIYRLHEKGEGFSSNSKQPTADEHRFGQKPLVDTISNTINEWKQANPNYPIVTNDLGYKSGGIDPHAIAGEKYYAKHHKDGNAIDLSYMVTPGVKSTGLNYDNNKAYDRDKTIEYIKTISRNIPEGVNGFVKFNDPVVREYFDKNKLPNLKITSDKPGKTMHSNHLHLELDLPKVN